MKGKLPVAVFRPRDATKNLEAAEALIGKGDCEQEFQQILQQQDFQFVGFVSRNGTAVLNGNGKRIGELKKGDSLVTSGNLIPACFGGEVQ